MAGGSLVGGGVEVEMGIVINELGKRGEGEGRRAVVELEAVMVQTKCFAPPLIQYCQLCEETLPHTSTHTHTHILTVVFSGGRDLTGSNCKAKLRCHHSVPQ